MQYIPFNGSAPTVQGLLTGAVDYIVDGTASHVSLIKSGKLRALAKLNSRPLPALPDVQPLSVEADNPALDDISTWIGFVAPAGTPRAIVEKIQREIAAMYEDPAIAEKLQKLRHQCRELDAGGVRRFRPQGDRPLGQGLQGQRHSA